jgi:uncharacterized membrane protein
LIASHAIAASLSLVLGAFQIIRPTKGDPVHKLIGRTWAVLSTHLPPAHSPMSAHYGA